MPDPVTRVAISFLNKINRQYVLEVKGIERLLNLQDPFIVVLNHSAYLEALLLPALLTGFREGRLIRFMADWNFLLVPVVSSFFKMGRIIPVTTKSARPKWLTGLRRIVVRGEHGLALARTVIEGGESVGIFPEGTVNKDDTQLLRGRKGAARLALDTGVSILPIGVRYPFRKQGQSRLLGGAMRLHVGEAISPSFFRDMPVMEVHQHMMQQIALLSGKRTYSKS